VALEPRPPRYEDVKKSAPPPVTPRSQTPAREQPAVRSQTTTREQAAERQPVKPVPRPASSPSAPAVQAPARPQTALPRGEVRQEESARPLPGHLASQTDRGHDRDPREAR